MPCAVVSSAPSKLGSSNTDIAAKGRNRWRLYFPGLVVVESSVVDPTIKKREKKITHNVDG